MRCDLREAVLCADANQLRKAMVIASENGMVFEVRIAKKKLSMIQS